METEMNFFDGDDVDLDDIIEGRGDRLEEENEDDDDVRRGDDEAEEAPAPKKKDDKDKPETTVKRKMAPRPKLDATRLAGPRGLLALEAESRNLKLKGRGHEEENFDLVLGCLQHWAHRLFPAYTFDDCLDKLEKLGTRKNVGVQIKKIRMGMTSVEDAQDTTIRGDDYVPDDDEDRPAPRLVDHDAVFNEVVATARPLVTPNQPAPQADSGGLTEEQKEKIMRNRMAAEERRLTRLKEQREQELRAQEEAAAAEAMEDMEIQ